jgi:hypothetical protein
VPVISLCFTGIVEELWQFAHREIRTAIAYIWPSLQAQAYRPFREIGTDLIAVVVMAFSAMTSDTVIA